MPSEDVTVVFSTSSACFINSSARLTKSSTFNGPSSEDSNAGGSLHAGWIELKLRAQTRRRNGDKMTEPTFSLVLTAAQAHQLFRLVGIGELALTERSRACRAASFTT